MSSSWRPTRLIYDLLEFHGQVEPCLAELGALGTTAQERGMRHSTHSSQYIVADSTTPGAARQGVFKLSWHSGRSGSYRSGPFTVARHAVATR